MARYVSLIFAADVGFAVFRAGLPDLDGAWTHHPDLECWSLRRDSAAVSVHEVEPRTGSTYARALDAEPRSRILLEIDRARGSEWLAAEIVLAAAERWPFVIEDAAETLLSVAEFQARVAVRATNLFVPDDWLSPDPYWRYDGISTSVDLLFPADFEGALTVARSLGARAHPDDFTDAELRRSGQQVWLKLQEARLQTDPYKVAEYRTTLGAPPYRSLRMQVLDGSVELATEFVEALAVHTALLAQGPHGQLMTVDDLRIRVANGARDPFCP